MPDKRKYGGPTTGNQPPVTIIQNEPQKTVATALASAKAQVDKTANQKKK
jgi:hypothetical protein